MYKTLITEPAEQDIAASARYIAEELQNPSAANKLLDDIETAIASLEKTPKMRALVQNEGLAELGFRILPVNKYLLFYIVREEQKLVTIERFLHSRRDWINIL
jgi:plasmid stabilization system protein ParE